MLVTGASRGIGQEISLQYVRAGASLAIVARSEESLGETKSAILAAVPSAEVLALSADVRDAQRAEQVVRAVLARFGKLDILISNAGAISPIAQSKRRLVPARITVRPFFFPPALHQKDPDLWWNSCEVNIRGVFNFFRCGGVVILLRLPRSWADVHSLWRRGDRVGTEPWVLRGDIRGPGSPTGNQRWEHIEASRESPRRVHRARFVLLHVVTTQV